MVIINMVMNMKDALKCFGLLAVGLLTAIFLYPFLHELGHVIAATFLGTNVCDFQLFPVPSVMCEMDATNELAIVIVGFGGMILPYLISCASPGKHFWSWYLWLVISVICLLSFIVSIVGIVLYKVGNPIANEDITRIMEYSDEYDTLYLGILVVLTILRVVQITRTNPIRRCLKEFDV